MRRFLATIVLTMIVGVPGLSAQHPDDLITRAERSTTTKELAELWDRVDPSKGDLPAIVDLALRSKSERARILGAMLLFKVKDNGTYRQLSIRAVKDPALEVRRISWLIRLEREGSLPDQSIQELLAEPDIVLQIVGVVCLADCSRLTDLAVTPGSYVVQAAAVRRLARTWPKAGANLTWAETAIDHALSSGDPLLRTAGLLSALRVGYFPVPTLRGVTFDSRPLLTIDELLDVTPRSQKLRVQYGLPGEFCWSFALLKRSLFRASLTILPQELPEAPMTLVDALRIGTIAGEGLIRANAEAGSEFIHRVSKLPLDKGLILQLEQLLKSEERQVKTTKQQTPRRNWVKQRAQEVDTTFTRKAPSLRDSLPRQEAAVVGTVRGQKDPAKALKAKRLLIPGSKIDGWIMHVRPVLRHNYEDVFGRDMRDVPPIYEFALRLPEDTSPRTSYILWGFNYDFQAKRYTIPNEKLKEFKDNDWVVVSGIIDPDTKIEWELVKDFNFPTITIGYCTLYDLKKLADDEKIVK